MHIHHPKAGSFSIEQLKTASIDSIIRQSSDIIIPLGSLEPYGVLGNYAVNSLCIGAVAAAVSSQLQIIAAPVLNYGCSSRFKAFPGSIGFKPKIFSSMLACMCNDCFFQGAKRVIILNSSEENVSALELLGKRYNNQNENKVEIFSLQSDKRVREFVRESKEGLEFGRSEFMMLSMASFLEPDCVSKVETQIRLPASDVYTAWRRRGRDPDKFRKLFPTSISSEIASQFDFTFGEKVFNFIVTLLCNQYSPLPGTKKTNATE